MTGGRGPSETVYVSLRKQHERKAEPEQKPREEIVPVEHHARAQRMVGPFKRAARACAAGARRVVGRVRHAVHARKAARAATAQ